MTTTGSEGEASAGGRSFLQKRLALFGLVLAVINAIGLLFQLATNIEGAGQPPFLLMCAGAVTAGLLTALRWVPPLSTRSLRAIEASTMLFTVAITGLIAHAIPAAHLDALLEPSTAVGRMRTFELLGPGGAYVAVATACIISAAHLFVLRAALVPSSARRTLFITTLGGVILAFVSATPIPGWAADEALWAELPEGAGGAMASSVAVWWLMTTVVCVVCSRVIHGLRREIRTAKRLGQYQLGEKLGEGGMGVVYRAQHALLRRETAIKLLRPDSIGEKSVARFEREVRLTATLTHPNTVTIYDYGRTPDGIFYYAMELLDGASLSEVVGHDGPQPPGRAVHVMRCVAGALREAHGRGLIHRDIKPGNIVLCDHGGYPDVPILLDFGLVKQLDGSDDAELTQEHSITGTPAYLAPEVIRSSDAAGPASDLYALGAVAYYLITGTHVFGGANVVEVCGHHLHSEPERPSERLGAPVPEALEELVLRMLAKKPKSRPASADDLLERIEALEGVDVWTLSDREAWWDANREALRQRATDVEVDGEADTLVIDLEARRLDQPS